MLLSLMPYGTLNQLGTRLKKDIRSSLVTCVCMQIPLPVNSMNTELNDSTAKWRTKMYESCKQFYYHYPRQVPVFTLRPCR